MDSVTVSVIMVVAIIIIVIAFYFPLSSFLRYRKMSRLIHGSFTPPLPKKVKSFEDLAEDYYNAGAILNRFKDRSSVHAFNQATQNLISALPDSLQRNVFQILAREAVDLEDFLKASNWREPFRLMHKDIIRTLESGPLMGFDEQSWKLPVPGNQFLFWLLQQGKEGENPYQSIRESFRKAYDAKTFLGPHF